jgi:transposase
MRISWPTVGKIVQRVVQRRLGDASGMLEGLRRIGLDELSYRKHHRYVSIVVDHDRSRVVWAGEGKSGETVDRFFELLGSERAAQLEVVSIDMSAGYEAALRKNAPTAEIVFDRFHVQKLAHDALDEVRREIVRELKGTPESKALKDTRHSLQRSDVNLTPKDKERIATVMATNAPLFRAWMLKTVLASILSEDTEGQARTRLEGWLDWASRSHLKAFVRVGRTIRKHFEGIMAYVRTGISNGRSEGMNGKVRVITRRAFGLHGAASLIAMLYLCCSGLVLTPRHA